MTLHSSKALVRPRRLPSVMTMESLVGFEPTLPPFAEALLAIRFKDLGTPGPIRTGILTD